MLFRSAYDGAGSAEFSNWPRAVLSLLPTKLPGEYRLVAGKRGQRLRWVMPDQITPCFTKLLRHSRQPGIICWQEVETAVNQLPANPANQPAALPNVPQPPVDAALDNGLNAADRAILAHLPDHGSVEKKVVLELVNQLTGIGDRRLRDSIKKLVAVPLIVEFKVDRPERVKAVYLRKEQPQPPQQQPQPADQPVEPPG